MSTGLTVREGVPLAPFTTLGIGGPARLFAEAATEEAAIAALRLARELGLPCFVLGGGSNLLVADEGFPGLALRLALTGISPPTAEGVVTAGAGEVWDTFVAHCVERDLAGLECLSGIPGWVGGSPVQNIGAYGQEVSETIVSVRAYDRAAARTVELSNADCGFAYRASLFNTVGRDRYLVLAVTFALRPRGAPTLRYGDVRSHFADRADTPTLAEVRAAVRAIRARKAMLLVPGDPDCRSAGSFFKNPLVAPDVFARIEATADGPVPRYPDPGGAIKVPAAWLIERSGFHKGYQRGRVGLSSRHTLALVNRGGATARDVLSLVTEIQTGVQDRFGVALHPEPVFVGFDGSPAPLIGGGGGCTTPEHP